MMPLYKYFPGERFAREFVLKGEMKFGSLAYFRGIEDGGARGDPKDGTLHYAPPDGIEITMVKDGRKLSGVSFTTAAQSMYVYCLSTEFSAERAAEFGSFCVEVADAEVILRRLAARASRSSRLDYDRLVHGPTEYRPLDKIPGVDWAFPERIVFFKPPDYAPQKEYRFALPLKPTALLTGASIFPRIGNLEAVTRMHRF